MPTLFVRFIILGISIALFFQCVSALLDPVYGTKKAIKWGLVTHTVAMFSVLTISCTLKRNLFLISYIDNREFSGAGPEAPSGPLEYPAFAHLEATAFVPSLILFRFDQWLADGLLVSSALNPVAQVSNTDRSFSCIVVMLFIPRTTGPPPFQA